MQEINKVFKDFKYLACTFFRFKDAKCRDSEIPGLPWLNSAGSSSQRFLLRSPVQIFFVNFAERLHTLLGCSFGSLQVQRTPDSKQLLLWSGVEGIFLIFAMRNVVNESLHHLLIIIGAMTPPLVVFFVLGFSFTTNENIYMSTYDADGRLLVQADL